MSAADKPALLAELRNALERALAPHSLEILDDSARHVGHAGARGGAHLRVRLVAQAFSGRSRLERHRLVYAAVAPLLAGAVHALNIEARAPGEAGDSPAECPPGAAPANQTNRRRS
jgi:BolA family transcriptional regulator, general stress-responsive regulator